MIRVDIINTHTHKHTIARSAKRQKLRATNLKIDRRKERKTEKIKRKKKNKEMKKSHDKIEKKCIN